MDASGIRCSRLINQQIAGTIFDKPREIVAWMGAMQAQEFAHVKWAVGLRLPGVMDRDVEKAFNDGEILRTHLLRPTWHFVSPEDIRWMLALTAPRVNAINAYYYRKFELDVPLFNRCNDVFVRELLDGKYLTRKSLNEALSRERIVAKGLRLSYIMMRAELDSIICSGPRQGNQFTYALLDERVPPAKNMDQDEALAELTMRYFTSRGPATIRDFAYWSGLTIRQAKQGVTMLSSEFEKRDMNGEEFLYNSEIIDCNSLKITSFLMPDYDEYGMSYKDRIILLHPSAHGKNWSDITSYNHMIVIDGIISGTWRQTVKKDTIAVETNFFDSIDNRYKNKVMDAIKRYCRFCGKDPEVL